MKGSSFGIADPPKPPPPAKTEVVCVEVTEVDGELVCCDGILFEPPPAGGQAGSLHSGHWLPCCWSWHWVRVCGLCLIILNIFDNHHRVCTCSCKNLCTKYIFYKLLHWFHEKNISHQSLYITEKIQSDSLWFVQSLCSGLLLRSHSVASRL